MGKLISVVVPVYNVEAYISELVDSLIHQTYQNLEIILVDDGSKDKSGSILDEYAAKDTRVKVIHKANAGVGAARNDGLAAATGEWIIFCDSDDWLELDALEKLVHKGDEAEADIVFGDVNMVYGDVIKPAIFYKNEFTTSNLDTIQKLIEADFCKTYCFDPPESGPAFGYGGPWNKLVKRSLLIDNNFQFDLRVKGIFDDILYTAYIFAYAKKVSYIHAVIYNYRQLADSITHKYKANIKEINAAIFVSWTEFMREFDVESRFKEAFYANVIRRFTVMFGQYYFNEKNTDSLGHKLNELSNIIKQEPYSAAIKNANLKKLNNNFDRCVVKAAKRGSVLSIYLLYELTLLKAKLKRK